MNIENVRPILTDGDLTWALAEIEPYFEDEPEPDSAAGLRFRFLVDRIAEYESARHPIGDADPVRVIEAAIRDMGRSQPDLGRLIGSTRASEILARKRPLTLKMIRAISAAWHIPIGALTDSYPVRRPKPPVRAVEPATRHHARRKAVA